MVQIIFSISFSDHLVKLHFALLDTKIFFFNKFTITSFHYHALWISSVCHRLKPDHATRYTNNIHLKIIYAYTGSL